MFAKLKFALRFLAPILTVKIKRDDDTFLSYGPVSKKKDRILLVGVFTKKEIDAIVAQVIVEKS